MSEEGRSARPVESSRSLFDRLAWRDPVGGGPLDPIVGARAPSGVPLSGALRVRGTDVGYPIVDCVARLTPELALRYGQWLTPFDLRPPLSGRAGAGFQQEDTVDSFGFQWAWTGAMRSAADLRWRVAERFEARAEEFRGKTVLDAGAGAGDQSRWLLEQGAEVVSVDLSSAIDVVGRMLRGHAGWFGIQGDIAALPFPADVFDVIYCEGVIQHTRDSEATVRELCRVLKPGGTVLATHYARPTRVGGRWKHAFREGLRRRLTRWNRHRLLFATGVLAAMGHVPVLGRALRASGLAVHSDRMPDFKTTWTNTFDYFGGHAFQRFVTAEEFWGYFDRAGAMEPLLRHGTVVKARKGVARLDAPSEGRGPACS